MYIFALFVMHNQIESKDNKRISVREHKSVSALFHEIIKYVGQHLLIIHGRMISVKYISVCWVINNLY